MHRLLWGLFTAGLMLPILLAAYRDDVTGRLTASDWTAALLICLATAYPVSALVSRRSRGDGEGQM